MIGYGRTCISSTAELRVAERLRIVKYQHPRQCKHQRSSTRPIGRRTNYGGKELSRKVSRESAITALVANPSIKAAAAACGISEKTIHQWLNDPAFASALKTAQDATTRAAMRRVVTSVSAAVTVLEDIMQDISVPPAARVSAARTLLDSALRVHETQDIEERIAAIERATRVRGNE